MQRISLPNRIIILALIFTLLPIRPLLAADPVIVFLPYEDMNAVSVVQENEAQLESWGCVRMPVDPKAKVVKVPADKLNPVTPITGPAHNEILYFCSDNVLSTLSTVGKVKAIFIPILLIWGAVELISWGFGRSITGDAIRAIGSKAAEGVANSLKNGGLINDALINISWYIAKAGNWLLHKFAALVVVLLSARKFVGHPFVQAGWPFILGVANLGFILALLFIAISTVLQLDIGGGVKRLLPRLLIAALMINFSLLIGGIVIDASRVVMGILTKSISGGAIEELPLKILRSSHIFSVAFDLVGGIEDPSTRIELSKPKTDAISAIILATILIWGLTFAFFTLVVGLFMRYVMLILLLIFSPFAYLAFALPNMGNVASKWWTEFLKYCLYGPAALFVLLFITRIPHAAVGDALFGSGPLAPVLDSFVATALTIAMLIAAVTVGRYVGVAGSAAAVGFATRTAKRLPAFAYRNPKTAAAIAGTVATGGLGGAALGLGSFLAARGAKSVVRDRVVRPIRDYGKEVTRPIRRAMGTGEYSPYDEKGNLKQGRTSAGSRAGSAPRREEINQTTAALALGGGHVAAANINDPAFNASRLRQGHVVNALGPNAVARNVEVGFILRNGTGQQARGLVQNRDYLRDLDAAGIARVEAGIRANAAIPANDTERILEQLYMTLDQIRNE